MRCGVNVLELTFRPRGRPAPEGKMGIRGLKFMESGSSRSAGTTIAVIDWTLPLERARRREVVLPSPPAFLLPFEVMGCLLLPLLSLASIIEAEEAEREMSRSSFFLSRASGGG